MSYRTFIGSGALALAMSVSVLSLGPSPAKADDLDALRGKTIRFIITSPATVGTGLYSRPLVDGLKRVLPDSSVLSQNISGGGAAAGIVEALNARGQAVTVMAAHVGSIYQQMTGIPAAPYDLRQFHWIGAMTTNQRVAATAAKGIKTLDDLKALGRTRQLISPAGGAGTTNHIEAVLVSAMTGLNLRVVGGATEAQRTTLMMSSDVDLTITSYYAIKHLVESGDIVPLFKIGRSGYPDEIKDLPDFDDVAREGTDARVLAAMDSLNSLGRIVAAAPNTAPEVVAALRVAFDKAMASPELAAAYEAQGLVLAPTKGAEVGRQIEELLGDPETTRLVAAYLDCGRKLSDDPAAACEP